MSSTKEIIDSFRKPLPFTERLGARIFVILFFLVSLFLIGYFTETYFGTQSSFIIGAAILFIICFILFFLCRPETKEEKKEKKFTN